MKYFTNPQTGERIKNPLSRLSLCYFTATAVLNGTEVEVLDIDVQGCEFVLHISTPEGEEKVPAEGILSNGECLALYNWMYSCDPPGMGEIVC